MASTKVPMINWSANNGELISKLITELEKLENFKVFLGKKEKYNASDMPFFTYYSIIDTFVKEYKWRFEGKGCKKNGTGHPSDIV
jgi:hypothetical protein